MDPRSAAEGTVSPIERLWAEHLAIDFPWIRGDEVPGVDLVLLDADIAEYVTVFLDNGGRLAPARRASLEALGAEARRAAESLRGGAREHFARLAHVAELVVGTAAAVPPRS